MTCNQYIDKWKYVRREVSTQKDGYNCGIHTTLNIYNYVNSTTSTFSDFSVKGMNEFRGEMVRNMLSAIYNPSQTKNDPKKKILVDLLDNGMCYYKVFQISILACGVCSYIK